MIDKLVLALWLITGVINLSSKEGISKVSYGAIWVCFILYLILRIVEHG